MADIRRIVFDSPIADNGFLPVAGGIREWPV